MANRIYVVAITDLKSDFGMGMPYTRQVKAPTNYEARKKFKKMFRKEFKAVEGIDYKIDSIKLKGEVYKDDKFKNCVKPLKCVCGKVYSGNGEGGVVTNGVTEIWCCSKKCADKTIYMVY